MMKAIQFIPDIFQLLRKLSYQSLFRLESFVHLSQRVQNQKAFSFLIGVAQAVTDLHVKDAVIYLSKAFGEGVKQNFLGPNVNTEFVSLTVKVYAATFARLITDNAILNSIKYLIK